MSTFDFPDNEYWLTKKRYLFNASSEDPLPIEHGTFLRAYGLDYVTNQSGTKIIYNGHKQDRDEWDGIKIFGFSLTGSKFTDKFNLNDAGLWIHWDTRVELQKGRDVLKINYGEKTFSDMKNHIGLNVHGTLDLGGGNDVINAKASHMGIEIGDAGKLKTGNGNDTIIAKSINDYALAIDNIVETGSGHDTIIGQVSKNNDQSGGIFLNFDAQLLTGSGKDSIDGTSLYALRRSQLSTGSGSDVIQAPVRSGSTNLKQRPIINMGQGQDYLRLDDGEYEVKKRSNGSYLVQSQRGDDTYFIGLEDIEFIAGQTGPWIELAEGMITL